ncbi:hypothetical protein NQ318_017523 [Aromia moschata]|uniref:Phosphorylated adapter RNA export protein n=1 Tax=Aromia moschata TaxID=1265417 RepID=A0AAV8Z2R8_9CUCU|nr:hypothetical protein NQ318_017523 [Aromia moschata]
MPVCLAKNCRYYKGCDILRFLTVNFKRKKDVRFRACRLDKSDAMEADQIEVEEGEISNDSDNNYTPLERPKSYSVTQPQPRFPVNQPSESEEEPQSSDSDSDSDTNVRQSKKPKIKLKPKPQQPKRKKYDVWCTRAQEDVLAETLNSCDVTRKDRSRDVESYDYTLARKYYEELEQRKGNKRTREDRRNVNFKQKKRSGSAEKTKGKTRAILDLTVDLNSSSEDLAKDMANKLCEEKEDLILRVINTMGKQKAIEIFKETKKIEEEGGMLVMNQTRRRTPGGVFLYLVRQDYHITREQRDKIFGEEKQRNKVNAKAKQKQKTKKWKCQIAASKAKLLPDLLTRAELLACQNPARKVKDETEETDVINPPPTPRRTATRTAWTGCPRRWSTATTPSTAHAGNSTRTTRISWTLAARRTWIYFE